MENNIKCAKETKIMEEKEKEKEKGKEKEKEKEKCCDPFVWCAKDMIYYEEDLCFYCVKHGTPVRDNKVISTKEAFQGYNDPINK